MRQGKMNYKKITIIIIISTASLLIGYDVLAIAKGGTEASISSVLINFSYKMPMFTFLFGFLCGHIFWRMKPNSDTIDIDNYKKGNE
jgi:hypothetical protein